MQGSSPWHTSDETFTDPSRLEEERRCNQEVVYLCAESLRICGILLQPCMPERMALLLDMLGVAPESRSFKDTAVGSDSAYGTAFVDLGKGHEGTLFPPLTSLD